MEFLAANELAILRWIHILAMVYWLGGEWGVFQTSYNVTNHRLSLEERKRHMETAYRIDILARTGIVLLLPLGLHMGKIYGFVPILEGSGIWIMWAIFIACVAPPFSLIVTRVGTSSVLVPASTSASSTQRVRFDSARTLAWASAVS